MNTDNLLSETDTDQLRRVANELMIAQSRIANPGLRVYALLKYHQIKSELDRRDFHEQHYGNKI